MNKRAVGSRYEALAVRYLQNNGVKVLERNFRNRGGEIDIIGKEGACFVFFEVKYRKDGAAGLPAEAVDLRKQTTICRVADYYRITHGLTGEQSFRFDIIAVLGEKITWYKNAFEYRQYYK